MKTFEYSRNIISRSRAKKNHKNHMMSKHPRICAQYVSVRSLPFVVTDLVTRKQKHPHISCGVKWSSRLKPDEKKRFRSEDVAVVGSSSYVAVLEIDKNRLQKHYLFIIIFPPLEMILRLSLSRVDFQISAPRETERESGTLFFGATGSY